MPRGAYAAHPSSLTTAITGHSMAHPIENAAASSDFYWEELKPELFYPRPTDAAPTDPAYFYYSGEESPQTFGARHISSLASDWANINGEVHLSAARRLYYETYTLEC